MCAAGADRLEDGGLPEAGLLSGVLLLATLFAHAERLGHQSGERD